MSEFDVRWRSIAGAGTGSGDETRPCLMDSPPGCWGWPEISGNPSVTGIGLAEADMGALGMIAAILLICAVLEMPHLRDQKPLEPGIENTVAQLVWSI